jgi:Uma2 family endonuclease
LTITYLNALIVVKEGGGILLKSKDLITAHRLAEELDLSVDTIWRYTRDKKIPFVEIGNKQYRYNLNQVLSTLAGSNAEKGRVDFESYSRIPWDPGYRLEVLDGVLVRDPSPNVNHQRIILTLSEVLKDYFKTVDADGELFIAPLDVRLDQYTVVQPDLFYLAGEQKALINESYINGAPQLVVEVLSPFNRSKDRLQKLQLYQKSKVLHYWIVDPEDKTMECYQLKDGLYSLVAFGIDHELLEHQNFEGLRIELGKLWPDCR